MDLDKNILEVIKERKSIRTYDHKAISDSDYNIIRNYIEDERNHTGPLGGRVRFEIVPVTHDTTDKGIKIGTYGFIKNPKAYIVGMIKSNTKIVDFGYVFEKLILYLTSIGIGTCWLGGTFNRNSFEKEIKVENDEIIPSITPLGYPSEKTRVFDKTLRFITKADNRKPWGELFFYKDFNTTLNNKTLYHTPLEMVRLGPSASNKQPWRVILTEDKNSLHFYLSKTPNYSGNKAGFEMQRIDIGIAMCHFEFSCMELGIQGQWTIENPKINVPNEHTDYIITWSEK